MTINHALRELEDRVVDPLVAPNYLSQDYHQFVLIGPTQ